MRIPHTKEIGYTFLIAATLLMILAAMHNSNAACTDPIPVPAGYAAPCPIFSASPATVPSNGTLTFTAAPPAIGTTSYIYNTLYISESTNNCVGKVAGVWCPILLPGPYVYSYYRDSAVTLTIAGSSLASFSQGTHWAVLWDWMWDAAQNCYRGPDGICSPNSRMWRIQQFAITQPTASPPPSTSGLPTIFLDLTVSGEGAQRTLSANVEAISGVSSLSPIDTGEYIARALDSGGNTLLASAFNLPHIVIGEGDNGTFDFQNSDSVSPPRIETALVLPVPLQASTLVITRNDGSPVVQKSLAGLVSSASTGNTRTVATRKNIFSSQDAHAAGGTLNIAVVGVSYQNPQQFDQDWQAFRDRLMSLEPFRANAAAVRVTPVYKNATDRTFANGDLACDAICNWREGYRECGQDRVLRAVAERGIPHDGGIVTFIQDKYGGCAYLTSGTGNAKFTFVNTETPGQIGRVKRNGVYVALTSQEASDLAGRTAVHEFGHSFGTLLDEYGGSSGSTYFLGGHNCSQTSSCSEWKNNPLIPPSIALQTSCFRECAGDDTLFWRSSQTSLMRKLDIASFDFNPLSKFFLSRRLAEHGIGGVGVTDTERPQVNLTSPSEGATIRGAVTLWASATDNVGVSRVELFANGSLVGTASAGAAPNTFRLDWNTANISDGSYRLTARASDAAGNAADSLARNVSVRNAGTPTPTACLAQGKNCGIIPDGIGGFLDCGTCNAAAGLSCGRTNVCEPTICTSESDIEFCFRQGKNCGSASGTDQCGRFRSVVNCGSCGANVCSANGSCIATAFSADLKVGSSRTGVFSDSFTMTRGGNVYFELVTSGVPCTPGASYRVWCDQKSPATDETTLPNTFVSNGGIADCIGPPNFPPFRLALNDPAAFIKACPQYDTPGTYTMKMIVSQGGFENPANPRVEDRVTIIVQ